jgi:hypothetical protein
VAQPRFTPPRYLLWLRRVRSASRSLDRCPPLCASLCPLPWMTCFGILCWWVAGCYGESPVSFPWGSFPELYSVDPDRADASDGFQSLCVLDAGSLPYGFSLSGSWSMCSRAHTGRDDGYGHVPRVKHRALRALSSSGRMRSGWRTGPGRGARVGVQ